MDMAAAAAQHEMDRALARAENKDLTPILILPAGVQLPNDGVLVYEQVTSVEELLSRKEGTVLVFAEKDAKLLTMLVENADLFGYDIQVLVGVPDVSYDVWWSTIVWKLDQVGYAALISEIALSRETAEQRRETSMTDGDRERDRITRGDGSVKQFTDYEVSTLTGSPDEQSDEEDGDD